MKHIFDHYEINIALFLLLLSATLEFFVSVVTQIIHFCELGKGNGLGVSDIIA